MQKSEIHNKINKTIASFAYDALIITGYDNIHYMTGVDMLFAAYRHDQPMFFVYTKENGAALVCPAEWVKTAIFTGRVQQVISYNASSVVLDDAMAKISMLIGDVNSIGIDLGSTKMRVANALANAFPKAELAAVDDKLLSMRQVKCETEKQLLKKVAMMADHGMNGAIHHVTVDRRTSALTLAEEFRVHTLERGIDFVGYHSSTSVLTGKGNDHYYTETAHYGYAETIDLLPAEMVRMVLPGSKEGYWTDATRIMIMGDMFENQENSYNQLVALRNAALRAVKPGNTAADVYNAMTAYAKENGIALQDSVDLGHGIGSALIEAPYINPCDKTVLQKDMVLVIAPVVKDEEGQLWIQKDTVIVTEDGCEIIGWYKDWREPYIPIASI